MNISREKLNRIIQEEYQIVMSELDSRGSRCYHSAKDGTFTSKARAGSFSCDGRQERVPSGKDERDCGRSGRKRCHDGELKYESAEEPNAGSTSRYRRDDPSYENERQRRDRYFPGSDEMSRLASGILETFDEALETIDERKNRKAKPRCLSTDEIGSMRTKMWNQLLQIISHYEDAKKDSRPKKRRA